jgi:hypothetical protein
VGRLLARVAGAVAVALGCQPQAELLELPPIPSDLQEVAAEYVMPTGTVPANAQAQIAQVGLDIDLLRETGLAEYITDRLVELRSRLEASGVSTGRTIVRRSIARRSTRRRGSTGRVAGGTRPARRPTPRTARCSSSPRSKRTRSRG